MINEKKEYSLRRSINNTLRKSSILKNTNSNTKNVDLKKFVPNIDKCKNESEILKNKSEYPKKEHSLEKDEEYDNETDAIKRKNAQNNIDSSDTDIDEIIKKKFHFNIGVSKESNREKDTSRKISDKDKIASTIKDILHSHFEAIDYEKLNEENKKKIKKIKNAINSNELSNVSKNIYYNKAAAPPSAYFIPLTLPFSNDDEKKKEKKIRKMFMEKESFFFNVQLPNMLPALIHQEKTKEQEAVENKEKENTPKKIKTEYKLSNINSLPSGKFAKLIIYKNKKIKMKIGDILFDADEGSSCTFSQEIACHIKDNSEFLFLGNCSKKIVVTPNIENMIRKT